MADIVLFIMKSRSIRVTIWRKTVWITMVKAHYVVITVQVDMNLNVICERIIKLQPAKKMMNES